MDSKQTTLTAFQENIVLKYQLYNGLFLTLPFFDLPTVGAELPLFAEMCESELQKGKSPEEVIEKFFSEIVHPRDFSEKIRILFLMLQFVERQVVLFDALEDAAFKKTHDMEGDGTLADFIKKIIARNKIEKAYRVLRGYRTRIVLTAHPTQFYPPQVLGIIHDLTIAIRKNNLKAIYNLLLQLGKTSFKNPKQPTPLDEANILIHHLDHVFYPVLKQMQWDISKTIETDHTEANHLLPPLFEVGFWPGGDRDGNPNVTAEITLQVAQELKIKILSHYIREIENLKRRLTFKSIGDRLAGIQNRLIATKQVMRSEKSLLAEPYVNYETFVAELKGLHHIIKIKHRRLFLDDVDLVIMTTHLFGFHFATLDLRQDSSVHGMVLQKLMSYLVKTNTYNKSLSESCQRYGQLSHVEKTKLLEMLLLAPRPLIQAEWLQENALIKDAVESLQVAQQVQKANGERGLHRYIISNTQSVTNVLEVMLLAYWAGWDLKNLSLDIVPLFETINDLQNASAIMRELYTIEIYRVHLNRRKRQQTIMLGFSDSTKDGGYVTANWRIFTCKKQLFELSKEQGITVIFFDGRGGPPARGGGNTHQFYRAMENIIAQKQIQLTIQGQTISSNFGTTYSAAYNIGQLFTSGLQKTIFSDLESEGKLSDEDWLLLEKLSKISYESYMQLKNHQQFLFYLERVTPLRYYGELNIASRPPRRKKEKEIKFADLRAIPFVGAWSQMKQNVPGFYGVGTALKQLMEQGEEDHLRRLYKHSLFFRTLLQNAMQSLCKSYFPLTQYLAHDQRVGEFWQLLHEEAVLSETMLKRFSGQMELLENEPAVRQSIAMREYIVLPLLVIQQYAMMQLRSLPGSSDKAKIYKKIILKSLAANTNASRNSA